MSDRQETYIYESPDGGHTVFRRQIGASASERELHSMSDEKRAWDRQLEREMKWTRILNAGEDDPVLRQMLDQIEIYHSLKSRP